ncbi:MAG: carbamoyltransferase family protein [Hyphomicrobiaceae bacterium]
MASETADSGIALLQDGVPSIVLEEERHSRIKHTLKFPILALNAAMERSNIDFADIDVITTPWDRRRMRLTFSWAVLRKFPASLAHLSARANTAQDVGLVIIDRILRRRLRRAFPNQSIPPVLMVGHHEAHAAMYFVSPFDDATIVVMDGYGDDAATSVFTANGGRIERRWHGSLFDSIGAIYTVIAQHLGFDIFEEGTVMALAASGEDHLVEKMRELVRLEDDGRFRVNFDYFSFDTYGMLQPFKNKFLDTFGPARQRTDPITDHHKNVARGLQGLSEEVILHVARAARKNYLSQNLIFAGGVAQNCVANARLLNDSGFQRVWVPPCASDTGTPLGSALWHYHQTLGNPRCMEMTHSYYGLDYTPDEIRSALEQTGLGFEELDEGALLARVSNDLASDKIVGWFQGRYEIGPRALGNRSILASPINPYIRDKINQQVKHRESFRPFAPSVLEEHVSEYFEISQTDPFMTMAPRVCPDRANGIQAAVHANGTARIQTVSREQNPRYHKLIGGFRDLTGVPMLLNTSFNKQEPIVNAPNEAISCFLRTDMDVLVLGDFYCSDRPQSAVELARSSFEPLVKNLFGGE